MPAPLTKPGHRAASPPAVAGIPYDAPSFDAARARVLAQHDFARHPYFEWMARPETSREAFLESQLPFRHAVEAFSQSLAATLCRIPSLEMRLSLAENIAEEHGHGRLADSHKHTFCDYLRALGAEPQHLAGPAAIAVEAFNQSLLGFCQSQPYEASAAALGMIEELYTGISDRIARTIETRQWTAPGAQRHYTVHAILDARHAEELYELTAGSWDAPRSREAVARGLALGAHYFWRLYVDLLPRD